MKIHFVLIWGIFLLALSCNQVSNGNEKPLNPIKTLSDPGFEASSVYLTTDHQGNSVASWVELDSIGQISFYFATFDASSESFGQPISAPIPEIAEIREEAMPKVAFKGDGSVFVLYQTSEDRDDIWGLTDLRFILSTDGGKNWTEPQSIAPEDYEQDKMSSYSTIARLDDGEIGITWLSDAQDMDITRPIKFTKTHQQGIEESQIIAPSGCKCCRVAITSGPDGKIGVAYRNITNRKERDISILHSFDNGKTFDQPVNFSGDHWEIYGCPVNGPSIVSNHDFSYVGWFTDADAQKGVNLAILNNQNEVLENHSISKKGSYIQVGITENMIPVAIYNEAYDTADSSFSRVLFAKINDNEIHRREISAEKSQSTTPVLSVLSNEKVLTAWSDNGKVFYRVVEL